MSDSLPVIDVPPGIIKLEHPLRNFFDALRRPDPVRIVAMGSSSTAGRADVVPYPHRLEMYLRQHYAEPLPDARIDVVNRGKGGQEAPEELKRFKSDIFSENPSLVLWQIGTNAVFHRDQYKFQDVLDAIADGVNQLLKPRQRPMDVVLIDPQYVTAMLREDKAELSERIVLEIRRIAASAKVNVFQRWALMRHWHVQNGISFEQLLDPTDRPDMLHQSDWSTLQVSQALCKAITDATMSSGWLAVGPKP